MSDSQVKSIIERILRLHADVKACRASLQDGDARHVYCLQPLIPLLDSSDIAAWRAFTAAARMLGVKCDTVRHRAAVWAKRDSYEAACAWRDGVGTAWPVPPLPQAAVGRVYLVAASEFPGLYKVGFSSQPAKRVKKLRQTYGTDMELLWSWPATWLDEHLAHVALADFRMANEWFDMDGRWRRLMPMAFFFTPHRMWTELREAA